MKTSNLTNITIGLAMVLVVFSSRVPKIKKNVVCSGCELIKTNRVDGVYKNIR